MFNLEQSIANWRKQMFAAGIKAPVPLEELESHLRDEIARQIQTGETELQAFESASTQIGRADLLKSEFKKSTGYLGWLGETRDARTMPVLALLWLLYFSFKLYFYANRIRVLLHQPEYDSKAMIFGFVMPNACFMLSLGLAFSLIHFAGIIASTSVLIGKGGSRSIVVIASLGLALYLVMTVGRIHNGFIQTISLAGICFAVFYLASIWQLWPRRKTKPAIE